MVMKQYIRYITTFVAILTLNYCNLDAQVEGAKHIVIGQLRNLYQVSDSVYRSEQPTKSDFIALQKYGIKSVLNLRYLHKDTDLISNSQLKFYHVPMLAFYMEFNKFMLSMKLIKTSPKPILVHCQHGSDRTGAVIALYRIVFQNWTKQAAINELKNGGFGHHTIFFNIPNFIYNIDIDEFKELLNKK